MANNYRDDESSSKRVKTEGPRQLQLLTNYFKVQINMNSLFIYEVKFEPEVEGYRVRTALIGQHEKNIGPFIPVGNNIYVKKHLGDEMDFVCTSRMDKSREYKLNLKFLKPADAVNAQSFFQIYNSLIKKLFRLKKFQLLGNRGYFSPENVKSFPEMRLELWKGIKSSLVNLGSDYGLCLNLELTHKVLRRETGLEYYEQLKRERGEREAAAEMEGAIVLTRYNNRTYRISRVVLDVTPQSTFSKRNKEGKQDVISFVDYYKEVKHLKISNLHQPMFEVVEKRKGFTPSQQLDNNNSASSNYNTTIYLVPELVTMTGLTDKMRSDFQLMKQLRTHTAPDPFKRVDELTALVKDLNTPTSDDLKRELEKWGLAISREMTVVNARLFPPEDILFAKLEKVPGSSQASWDNFYQSKVALFDIALPKEWFVMYVDSDARTVTEFLQDFRSVAEPLGMNFSKPQEIAIRREKDNDRGWVDALRSLRVSSQPLVLCMLPTTQASRYNAIKTVAIQELGFVTQCMVTKTYLKKKKNAITKMMLQLSSKLGGQPWAVKFDIKVPTMIVGIDVSYAKKSRSSLVGFVASYTDTYCKYYSDVKQGVESQEVVPTLAGCMKAAIEHFFQRNGLPPGIIIVYRDGVSEEQLAAVIEHEIPSCKSIFQVWPDYNPLFEFITVNKRINTRFFTMDRKNPSPGTSIDCINPLTVKREKYQIHDFFLIAQNVRQGTVSPCQYHVLEHTDKFTPEQIQHLTFKLCHLYPNWTGTVAIPAPVQLAHRLAHLHGHSITGHGGRSDALADKIYFI